ncbi:MAG TPA: site-2 protease family protein [Cyanobacteria bacterium UBA8156]|jgi:membrane-associated protease RseP (regulator of RpoE activity)|nr:site-2 protease family protein [Cyanobacteria bacterium UBA8156]
MNFFPYLPLSLLLVAVVALGLGFQRARRFGRAGLLAWARQVVLLAPWPLYLGLWLLGYFPNVLLLLGLLLLSTWGYVWLGRQLQRTEPTASQEPQPPSLPAIPPEDVKQMQGIFGIETFYATETRLQEGGIVFRGNLRGEPNVVHGRLTAALKARCGDRYDLFLTEGPDGRPTVVILPRNPKLRERSPLQLGLAGVLAVVSGIAVFGLGDRLGAPLELTAGTVGIVVARELALRWQARRYQVLLTPPFLLPSSQIGSFGAFARVKTPLPSRKALFDLAIAPAITSIVLSLLVLGVGLRLTALGQGTLELPPQIFQNSVVVGLLARGVWGKALQVDLLAVHPWVLVGWLGLVISALHLMPAGQLDGGRIVHAIYGRRTAGWTTLLTLLALGVAVTFTPIALYWGGLILILLRDRERPMLEELSELDGDREALGIAALFWMLLTLVPLSPLVAERLGIG